MSDCGFDHIDGHKDYRRGDRCEFARAAKREMNAYYRLPLEQRVTAVKEKSKGAYNRESRRLVVKYGTDWVVVDRLMAGVPVYSTPAERHEAIDRLRALGVETSLIAERVGVSPDTVTTRARRKREREQAA